MSGQLERLLAEATPGPWRYRPDDGMVLDAEDYFVVSLKGSPHNEELAASARLAALAPDLARLLVDAMAFVVERYGVDGWLDDDAQALLARFAVLEQKAGEGQG